MFLYIAQWIASMEHTSIEWAIFWGIEFCIFLYFYFKSMFFVMQKVSKIKFYRQNTKFLECLESFPKITEKTIEKVRYCEWFFGISFGICFTTIIFFEIFECATHIFAISFVVLNNIFLGLMIQNILRSITRRLFSKSEEKRSASTVLYMKYSIIYFALICDAFAHEKIHQILYFDCGYEKMTLKIREAMQKVRDGRRSRRSIPFRGFERRKLENYAKRKGVTLEDAHKMMLEEKKREEKKENDEMLNYLNSIKEETNEFFNKISQ